MLKFLAKIILFVVLLVAIRVIFLAVSSISHVKKNDLQELNLFGKVKSISENSTYATERFGRIEKDPNKKSNHSLDYGSYIVFNEHGYKTEEYRYKSTGELSSKNLYKYNDKGDLSEVLEYSGSGDLNVNMTFNYNEMGHKSETIARNNDGVLRWRALHKYDADGILLEEYYYFSNGKLSDKFIYKYNEGKKVQQWVYDDRDSLVSKMLVKQFRNDLPSEVYFYNRYSGGAIEKYKYDEYGNKIEKINFYDNRINGKLRFTFEYDDQKNWTKMIKYENDILLSITERDIEYFED